MDLKLTGKVALITGSSRGIDGAKAALARSLELRPEVNSVAQWYEYLPWTSKTNNPQYWALEDRTLTKGLRRIGFPEN